MSDKKNHFITSLTYPLKASSPRKIAVIGGGIAGMEAASTAAEGGHAVELFERRGSLGGEMIPSGACDPTSAIRKLQEWMLCRLEKQGISVHLNRNISVEEIRSSGFDTVILATGAGSAVSDPIKGVEKTIPAASAIKDISNIGKKVIVVGGSIMGLETDAGRSESHGPGSAP